MSYKTILVNTFFVLMLFPYVTFFHNSSDLQPWALVFGCILALILFFKEKISPPTSLKLLLLVAFYAGIFFIFDLIVGKSEILLGIHSLVDYASVFIFSYLGYATFYYVKSKNYLYSIGIWLAIAFSQILFGASIIAPFLSRFSDGGPRGITGLTPEPAFFASLCIAFIVLNEFFYYSKKYSTKTYCLVFFVLLLQIILSYSGVGIMLLILLGISKLIELFFIKEEKIKKTLAFSAILVIIFSITLFSNTNFLGRTRGGDVFNELIKNPFVAIINNDKATTPTSTINDPSVSHRLMNPILGLYGGLVETRGVGFGLGSKEESSIPVWLSELLGEQRNFGGRIEGGLVQTIYELGVIGVLFTITIFYIVIGSITKNKEIRPILITSFFVIFIPMFIFGSIALPLFGYIIGIHLYYLYKKEDII